MLIFGGIPLLIVVVLAAMSMLLSRSTIGTHPPRYRLGQPWTHPPVLWSATDESTTPGHAAHHALTSGADLIGDRADGSW